MTRLAGEFQTDVPLEDALTACSEAIDSLGWRIDSVGMDRIVSRAGGNGESPPTIEVMLDQSNGATEIQIVGSDSETNPLSDDELIAELSRARDAIQSSLEEVEHPSGQGPPEDADQAPVQGPPAGWYPDPTEPDMERYWTGSNWGEQRPVDREPAPPRTADRREETPRRRETGPRPPDQEQVVFVKTGNGMAVAALACGVVGAITGLIPILFIVALPLGILAVIFGIVGRRRAKQDPRVGRQGMATAGIVTGLVAIVLGIVGIAIVNDATEDFERDLDEIERDFNQDLEELE